MATRRAHDQRYSQPRDFMRIIPKSRRKHAHRYRASEDTYDASTYPSYQNRRETSRSRRSDIRDEDSFSDSDSEEEDSEAEYITHREQSQGDHITPYSSSGRPRDVRFSHDDYEPEDRRLPRASPPTRVPFATFNHERLESHRGSSQKSKSRQKHGVGLDTKRAKKTTGRNLETWGFGGHDEGAMSMDEQHASRTSAKSRMAGEFPSSDIDEYPPAQQEDDLASDIASIPNKSESESERAAPSSSTAPSSFCSPPIQVRRDEPSDEDSSAPSRSDVEVDRPEYPHSSFSAPLSRREPRPKVKRDEASYSSFSAPVSRRKQQEYENDEYDDDDDYQASSPRSDIQVHRPEYTRSSFSAPITRHGHKVRESHQPRHYHEHNYDDDYDDGGEDDRGNDYSSAPQSSFCAPISSHSRTRNKPSRHNTYPEDQHSSFSAPLTRQEPRPNHGRQPRYKNSSRYQQHHSRRPSLSNHSSFSSPQPSAPRRITYPSGSSRSITSRHHLSYPYEPSSLPSDTYHSDPDADPASGTDMAPAIYRHRSRHARNPYQHEYDYDDEDRYVRQRDPDTRSSTGSTSQSDVQDCIEDSGDDECIDTRVALRDKGRERERELAEVVRPIRIWAW